MKRRYNLLVFLMLICATILLISSIYSATNGEHKGEKSMFDIWISVNNPSVNADSISEPLFEEGQEVNYDVSIALEGERTFNHLFVRISYEYDEDIIIDNEVIAQEGDLLPGSSVQEWYYEQIVHNDPIIIPSIFYILEGTPPGTVRVHLEMFHWKQPSSGTQGTDAPGRPFYEDSETIFVINKNLDNDEEPSESVQIQYRVEFLDHYGYTDEGYSIYYGDEYVHYKIHLDMKNDVTINNLFIRVSNEYYSVIPGDYPEDYSHIKRGDLLPGDPIFEFHFENVEPGQEIILDIRYYFPNEGPAALDQVHLQLFSRDPNEPSAKETRMGNPFLDDPQAGIFDPPVK